MRYGVHECLASRRARQQVATFPGALLREDPAGVGRFGPHFS